MAHRELLVELSAQGIWWDFGFICRVRRNLRALNSGPKLGMFRF